MRLTKTLWLTAKTALTYCLWILVLPPCVCILAILSFLPKHIRYKNPIFFSLSSMLCKILTKTMFIPIKISGTIPNEKFVIVMNHMSNLDAFFADELMDKKPRLWMAKDLVSYIPIVGFIFAQMHILVNRDRGTGAARALIKAIKTARAYGSNLMLFPEGTRNFGKRLLSFNKGFARAARILNRPVLPIAIHGTDKIFNANSPLINSNNNVITLVIGKAMNIKKGEIENDFASRVQHWFKLNTQSKLR